MFIIWPKLVLSPVLVSLKPKVKRKKGEDLEGHGSLEGIQPMFRPSNSVSA